MKQREIKWTLAALAMLVCSAASGQSFTFVPVDTVRSGLLGSTVEFNITITNTSTQVLTLALVRTLNDLPQGWESSMCLGSCFPPTIDSILTTPAFGSSPLNPGESRPFSVDIYMNTNQGTGTVRIVARNTHNASDQRVLTFTAISLPTGVEMNTGRPASFSLSQNYPNPFNPVTSFQFSVGNRHLTILKVYDVLGREVATLVNEARQPGTHTVQWDASGMPSGVYFYRLEAGNSTSERRCLLLR